MAWGGWAKLRKSSLKPVMMARLGPRTPCRLTIHRSAPFGPWPNGDNGQKIGHLLVGPPEVAFGKLNWHFSKSSMNRTILRLTFLHLNGVSGLRLGGHPCAAGSPTFRVWGSIAQGVLFLCFFSFGQAKKRKKAADAQAAMGGTEVYAWPANWERLRPRGYN